MIVKLSAAEMSTILFALISEREKIQNLSIDCDYYSNLSSLISKFSIVLES